MSWYKIKITILAFCLTLVSLPRAIGQLQLDDRHVSVALRMVGHQMLLNSGDSTSRVLPVTTKEDSYELSFEKDLSIDPGQLVTLIDSVAKETEIAKSYLVEVKTCDSNTVVYSYEIGGIDKMDIIPCKGRELPQACYLLSFTILEFPLAAAKPEGANVAFTSGHDLMPMAISAALLAMITFLWFYFRKKAEEPGPNMIMLGTYGFDARNMMLMYEGQQIELTSKECDLLQLLYDSVNQTLERETILNRVWGDEGDYVGRTLDVFISKLRKKLEGDSNLKIVNVRGVGYKLIMNPIS